MTIKVDQSIIKAEDLILQLSSSTNIYNNQALTTTTRGQTHKGPQLETEFLEIE